LGETTMPPLGSSTRRFDEFQPTAVRLDKKEIVEPKQKKRR
jgi:hypothetical protein